MSVAASSSGDVLAVDGWSWLGGILPLLGLMVGCVLILAGLGVLGRRRRFGVRKKQLMTGAERRMMEVLEGALPEFRVHAQVSMGALLDVRKGLKGTDRLRARGRFSQKIVDFVIEDRGNGDVVALVELDDRSHSKKRDAERDAMTGEAGYKTVRFSCSNWPRRGDVRSAVLSGNERMAGVAC